MSEPLDENGRQMERLPGRGSLPAEWHYFSNEHQLQGASTSLASFLASESNDLMYVIMLVTIAKSTKI